MDRREKGKYWTVLVCHIEMDYEKSVVKFPTNIDRTISPISPIKFSLFNIDLLDV
jgi:hypothetical protein